MYVHIQYVHLKMCRNQSVNQSINQSINLVSLTVNLVFKHAFIFVLSLSFVVVVVYGGKHLKEDGATERKPSNL